MALLLRLWRQEGNARSSATHDSPHALPQGNATPVASSCVSDTASMRTTAGHAAALAASAAHFFSPWTLDLCHPRRVATLHAARLAVARLNISDIT